MEKLDYPKPCKYKGEAHEIITKQKDFTTKKEYYFLKGITTRIPVEEVTVVKGKGKKNKSPKDVELVALRAAYQEAIGKEVPKNKKNDRAWMMKKVDEALEEDVEELTIDFALLMDMDLDALKRVIEEKELEIDPEDYLTEDKPEDLSHLVIAIAEELEIEVPE